MWNNIHSIIVAGIVWLCVIGIALSMLLTVAIILAPIIRRSFEFFRSKKPIEKAVISFAVLAAILYGGSKPLRPAYFGADADLNVIDLSVCYDSTNDVTDVKVYFTTGSAITTSTPVSVRNASTEIWRELEKIYPTIILDLSTNIFSFAVLGNETTNNCWWIGYDTPAIIIETTDIEITSFSVSSHAVEISWTCEDPNATEFVIQRRHTSSDEWETVGVTSSHSYIYTGFTVGETWIWRVSCTYEKEGN